MYKVDIDFKDIIIKSELLDYGELKKSFVNVVNTINDRELIKMIRMLPRIKPVVKFKLIYYILDAFRKGNELEEDFEVMRGFIEKEVDIFMLVNYLKKSRTSLEKRA